MELGTLLPSQLIVVCLSSTPLPGLILACLIILSVVVGIVMMLMFHFINWYNMLTNFMFKISVGMLTWSLTERP